ncbi:MAG: hypothetical protein AAGA60_12870 [Cyanobacteria bacterium P01_E01_bin.42]
MLNLLLLYPNSQRGTEIYGRDRNASAVCYFNGSIKFAGESERRDRRSPISSHSYKR